LVNRFGSAKHHDTPWITSVELNVYVVHQFDKVRVLDTDSRVSRFVFVLLTAVAFARVNPLDGTRKGLDQRRENRHVYVIDLGNEHYIVDAVAHFDFKSHKSPSKRVL
jgi:hypothetical protein